MSVAPQECRVNLALTEILQARLPLNKICPLGKSRTEKVTGNDRSHPDLLTQADVLAM